MANMRHLMFAVVLLSACGEPVDPTENLCPNAKRTEECSERCKPEDGSAGEVCGVDDERACLDECVRCNPSEAWCPAD